MGGLAAIARAAGHTVTGSDQAVYPPMSDQLRALGIELIDGFAPEQLSLKPDLVVVGNVMSRGMPIVEEMLNRGMPYTSGPAWLAEHVLKGRHVIAVSGTHGKTTTASMIAWLLEHAGLEPGFLIGGVPGNFDVTARLGSGEHFVIEADEYDTAFFDKRAKFLHYGPETLILNNLEFDHADIYKDMDAILWQFHQLLRLLPGKGCVIANAAEPYIEQLLEMGCWSQVQRYSSQAQVQADWHVQVKPGSLSITDAGGKIMTVSELALPGLHNGENALAALLAAMRVGVDRETGLKGLGEFRGVKRRLECLGTFGGVRVYDDFAHHPTAIRRTLEAVRQTASGRVIAVLEPRSNSMKLGVHSQGLAESLRGADFVWAYQAKDLPWSLTELLADVEGASVATDIDTIVAAVAEHAETGDDIVIMSNGGFAGLHGMICSALEARS